VIFYGHTHPEMPQLLVHGVLLSQAKNWGISLARRRGDGSRFKGTLAVMAKASKPIPVTADIPADPDIMKLAEPYPEATLKYFGYIHREPPQENSTACTPATRMIRLCI
jgi:2',3'-cyclic-nucleotide 2'-phosphodiesterase / 3'-nucleotidase